MAEKKRIVYSGLDKEIFKQILKKYAAVVENKKTDGATLKSKELAWEKIAMDFNSVPTISDKRSSGQLKKLWSNMKQLARDQMTRQRQSRLATGGGPPLPDEIMDTEVLGIAPHLMVTIPATIDSDMSAAEVTEACNDQYKEVSNDQIMISLEEEYIDSPASLITSGSSTGDETQGMISSAESSKCPSPSPQVTTRVTSEFRPPSSLRKRGRDASECSSLSSAAKEETDLRLTRQRLLIEQDEVLFHLKKADAEEELQTSKLRRELTPLQLEDMKKRMLDDDLL